MERPQRPGLAIDNGDLRFRHGHHVAQVQLACTDLLCRQIALTVGPGALAGRLHSELAPQHRSGWRRPAPEARSPLTPIEELRVMVRPPLHLLVRRPFKGSVKPLFR